MRIRARHVDAAVGGGSIRVLRPDGRYAMRLAAGYLIDSVADAVTLVDRYLIVRVGSQYSR